MVPAAGLVAPPPTTSALQAEYDGRRLAAALDRIVAALVHRAERDAVARDRREHEGERLAGEALDVEAVSDLRDRVDAAIGRVRAALGDAAG